MDIKDVMKVLLCLSANGYDEMTVLDLLELLKDGAKSATGVSTALRISDRHARSLLSRAKKRKLVVNLGSGLWGLSFQGNEEER